MNSLKEKMKKRLSKEYTIEDLIEHIKGKQYQLALAGVLQACEHKQRIGIVTDIFSKSKYRSYKLGMQKFQDAINKFLGGNRTALVIYKKDFTRENEESGYAVAVSIFSRVVDSILLDALNNQPAASCVALMDLVTKEGSQPIDDSDLLKFVGLISGKIWPDHQALQVLFG